MHTSNTNVTNINNTANTPNILIDLDTSKIHSLWQLLQARVEKTPNDIANNYWSIATGSIENAQCKQDGWKDFSQRCLYLAQELKNLQVKKVALFLPTSYTWLIADYACLALGIDSYMYHNAWQISELEHAIMLDIPQVIICCEYLYQILEKSLHACGLWGKVQIIMLDAAESKFFEQQNVQINHEKHEEIFIKKIDLWQEEILHIQYDDLQEYCAIESKNAHSIAFTSGSSGNAKGVMLAQKSMLIVAIEAYQTLGFDAYASNFFHWMPFPHLFGRVAVYISVLINAKNYFSRGIAYFVQDVQLSRPKVLFAVPKVLGRLQHRIESGIQTKPWLIRKISTLYKGLGYTWQKLPTPISLKMQELQKKLFHAIHSQFGSNLQVIIAGGAPVCGKQKRYFEALGIRVCEGFGMTETAGVVSIEPYHQKSKGAGRLLPSVQTSFSPQKELLLQGDILIKKYITKNQHQEIQVFNTEDIAHICEKGHLHITGRTKEIIITQNGENVHPSKMEHILSHHAHIEDSCIVGDNRTCLIALIVLKPNTKHDSKLDMNIKNYLKQINERLPRFERIYNYAIVPSFVDFLTVTQKKKRAQIISHYKYEIEMCYKNLANSKQ